MAKPASGTPLDTGHALYTGLIHAWGLLEGTGTACADSRGSNNATISGGVTWSSDGGGPFLVGDGASGAGVLGSTFFLHTGFTTGAWSVAWRASCTGIGGHYVLGSVANGYYINMSPTVGLNVNCQVGHNFTGLTDFSADADYLVVADGATNLTLYKDGSPVDTATGCDTRNAISAICGLEASLFYAGRLDYVYVWDSALSSGDATTLHADPYAIFAAAPPPAGMAIAPRRSRALRRM